MMGGSIVMLALWSSCRRTTSFVAQDARSSLLTVQSRTWQQQRLFLFSTASSDQQLQLDQHVSRYATLQRLLVEHGAPGSRYCATPHDLEPILAADTPELVATLMSKATDSSEYVHLHPYLLPICRSQARPQSLICAYRPPAETDELLPWPIVETQLQGPGFEVLALNSEHLMRRMACEADVNGRQKVVRMYNDGLGDGNLADAALDTPYQAGSVAQLGYGLTKYVLLRVGPFVDLYHELAQSHADEQSSLIAAETCNAKFPGFASVYLRYAALLHTYPARTEETRDAARMCLRLPLPTLGLDDAAFQHVAELAQVAPLGQSLARSPAGRRAQLRDFYLRLRQAEKDNDNAAIGPTSGIQASGMTETQILLEECNNMINLAALSDQPDWSALRPPLAKKLRDAGRDGLANFVELK